MLPIAQPVAARGGRRLVLPLLLLLLAVLGPGCSHYRVGSLMHPQVHRLAIARVTNPTDEPRLGITLQDKLRNSFMQDHSLTVVDDPAQADSILYCRVVKCDYVSAGGVYNQSDDRTNNTYLTNLYEVQVTVEYTVRLPDRAEPLIVPQTVIGKANFTDLADLEITRRQAQGVALADAARRVTSAVTEAW